MKKRKSKAVKIQEQIWKGIIKAPNSHVHNKKIRMTFYVDDYFIKGIYFLYKDKTIVYVGMSETNVFNRICSHYLENSKAFDSFSIRNYEDSSKMELLSIEASLIKKYSPIYNIIHNGIDTNKAIF